MANEKFEDVLCHLNTSTDKYLKVKTAFDIMSENPSHIGREVVNTILDVLGDKMAEYEEEIVDQATKLSQAKDDDEQKS